MKIGISGAGKMAHVVKAYAEEKSCIGGEIELCGMYEPLGEKSIEEVFEEVPDVLIDFSNPANIDTVCEYAEQHGTALVIATTGCGERERKRISDAGKKLPVVFSANYSLGIVVMEKVIEEMTEVLGDDFDIEIVEKHHKHKLDAPSGTALLLADAVNVSGKYEFTYGRFGNRKRVPEEVGIHAVRGGGIVGDHSVYFAGDDELIEVSHRAGSRKIFAAGALKAARFAIYSKPGVYKMRDVIWGA